MTLDQVKNYAEHSGNPIIRDLCEMVLILDASNARAHECAEREKERDELKQEFYFMEKKHPQEKESK